MVGGGNRRDDGSLGMNRTNVFAALESLRRKKKTDKEQGSSKNKSSKNQVKEPEPQVFWAPAPLTVKSWADVDDDDDYYATTAPPQSVWGLEPQLPKDISSPVEESESEDDGLDEGDDDVEEEHSHEAEPLVPAEPEPVSKHPPQAHVAPKEVEKQLSKKELKKKELAELEAVLAELGIKNETNGEDEPHGYKDEKKVEPNGDIEKKESAQVPTERKNVKKKKAKREKPSKEGKDQQQEQSNETETNSPDEAASAEPIEQDTSAIDLKERLKKVAYMKKKKSSKEMDAAAKAAAVEAAARSARLAAAKKKEKNHYNQQPVR